MEASVEFLLNNLRHMVTYQVQRVGAARSELRQLNDELCEFQEILKEVSQKYKRDEIYEQWERNIIEAVYDIENFIDTCIIHSHTIGPVSFRKLFGFTPSTLVEVVKTIRRKGMQTLFNYIDDDQFKSFTAVAEPPVAAQAMGTSCQKSSCSEDSINRDSKTDISPLPRTKNVVGFGEEAKYFIDFLNGESDKLEIASIVGMVGLGKTTLAWKIFDDPSLQYEFPVRIWVNISNILNMKNVLLTILKHFTTSNPPKAEEDLLKLVKGYLADGKILIVLDDIRTIAAWQKIKELFPSENHECKVLITTRIKSVAEAAATRGAHYLHFLTTAESWELLQYKINEKFNEVHEDLVGIGQIIATDCDGLPLSLVVIGGIMLEKKLEAGKNISAIKKAWSDISKSVKPYLVDGDKKKLLSSIISLSYEKIPYELRNCFLYLGVFPEDANIPVKELLRLWIAEGFIQEKGGKTMEQIALENLKDFINRDLVMVKEAKFDGEPKICHIHDSVREICKIKANFDNLNLFQEITRSTQGFFEPWDKPTKEFRRFSIHSYVVSFLKQTRKVPNSRSFLCFHPTSIPLSLQNMNHVIKIFGLLRVYNAKDIEFPIFPTKLAHLIHLRYLTLVVENCFILPASICELWNLQTLIVNFSSNTLDIRGDIWKMRQLRHLKTKATIFLRSNGKGEGGENLQTLCRLSPQNCTNKFFTRASNLITLGIQGELDKYAISDGLFKLVHLQKLKLVNQVLTGVMAENPLRILPEPQHFPPNLKILVVNGTYMQWSKMNILSQLRSLKVLKLKENSFNGKSWEAVDVFHHLEHLHIERLPELVSWKAPGSPFPKLNFLLLNNCEKLIGIPDGVCENLEMLYLERVTKEDVISAMVIAERKQKNGVAFKLEIAPADKIQKKP